MDSLEKTLKHIFSTKVGREFSNPKVINTLEELALEELGVVAQKIRESEKGCPFRFICFSYKPSYYCCKVEPPCPCEQYSQFADREKMVPLKWVLGLLVEETKETRK